MMKEGVGGRSKDAKEMNLVNKGVKFFRTALFSIAIALSAPSQAYGKHQHKGSHHTGLQMTSVDEVKCGSDGSLLFGVESRKVLRTEIKIPRSVFGEIDKTVASHGRGMIFKKIGQAVFDLFTSPTSVPDDLGKIYDVFKDTMEKHGVQFFLLVPDLNADEAMTMFGNDARFALNGGQYPSGVYAPLACNIIWHDDGALNWIRDHLGASLKVKDRIGGTAIPLGVNIVDLGNQNYAIGAKFDMSRKMRNNVFLYVTIKDVEEPLLFAIRVKKSRGRAYMAVKPEQLFGAE